MRNSERFHFQDFTRDNYRRLLRLAKDNYHFANFTDFNREGRFLLLRHDIDCSIHAARKMARIEAEEGIKATYFVFLHSEFYNLLEKEVTGCLFDILNLGHALGLHFFCEYYEIEDEMQLEKWLDWEKRILEKIFCREIKVFSFHNPTPAILRWSRWQYAGLINTYAEYFQTQVGYCSDSNGYWRHRRLEDVLLASQDRRLQILIHPEMWQDAVMSPRERVYRAIFGRALRTKEHYDRLLAAFKRDNLDW